MDAVAPSVPGPPADLSNSLAAGTRVPVELSALVDSSFTGRDLVGARVTEDVKGPDGRTAIPAGSSVTLIIREANRKGPISVVVLGLYSVFIAGRQFSLSTGQTDAATLSFSDDAGKGPGHSAVHLNYGYPLTFKLDTAVQLR